VSARRLLLYLLFADRTYFRVRYVGCIFDSVSTNEYGSLVE